MFLLLDEQRFFGYGLEVRTGPKYVCECVLTWGVKAGVERRELSFPGRENSMLCDELYFKKKKNTVNQLRLA